MRTLPVALLAACSADPGLTGTWEGTCDLQGSVPEHYDLTYEITDDRGVLSGTAEVFPDWMTEPVTGTLEGSVEDEAVQIVATLGDAGVNFTLDLAGTLDGDEISGDCASEAAEGTGELAR